jgi:hypothetical protein
VGIGVFATHGAAEAHQKGTNQMREGIEGRNSELGWIAIPDSCPLEFRARIRTAREQRLATSSHDVKPKHVAGASEDHEWFLNTQLRLKLASIALL